MLNVNLSGKDYNEKCTLLYFGQELYRGYVDHLITSEKGFLEMRLNYGIDLKLSVRVTHVGNIFFLIPTDLSKYDWVKQYKPVIVTLDEIKNIWKIFRYDFSNDMKYIFNVNFQDILLIWALSSKVYFNQSNPKDVLKVLSEKVITSMSDNLVDQLISLLNELVIKNYEIDQEDLVATISIKKIHSTFVQEKENVTKWDAILEDNNGNFFLNLGRFYLKLPI